MALEIVKKEISLNVGQPNNFELICAMQGDNKSFEITATLYDVNKLYTINTDNIKIKGVNPLGSNLYKDIKGHTANTVTFALTEDMLAYDGLLKLVLVLTESSTQLTTFPFVIKVVNSPGNTDADDMKTVSALVEEAQKWAMLSKSYAVGTNNEVRKGDAKDNSKYYYEQIKELLDSGKIGNGKILYFDTYKEFQNELDAGKIEDETLICIKEGEIDSSGGNPGDDNKNMIAGTLTGDYLIMISKLGRSYFSKDDGITWGILEGNGLPDEGDFWYFTIDDNNDYYITTKEYYSINNKRHCKRYIYKSSDAQTWECISTIEGEQYDLCAYIKYINNKLFIFGGFNYCFSSSDHGVTWQTVNTPVNKEIRELGNGGSTNEYGICNIEYLPSIKTYVASGRHGHNYYSKDGNEWTEINGGMESDHTFTVATFNDTFIMAGVYNASYSLNDCINEYVIYTSTDGIYWTLVYTFSSDYKFGSYYEPRCLVKNGHCVFITSYYIFHSNDGINWTVTKNTTYEKIITYFHNNFIILNNNFTNASSDGISWEAKENNISTVNGIERNALGDILIAVQEGENI